MPVPSCYDWLYDAVCFKASHNSYQGASGKPSSEDHSTYGHGKFSPCGHTKPNS